MMPDTARTWLARTMASLGPALRALAGDPALAPDSAPIAGFEPPAPPTVDEIHQAATTIERMASCLRHAEGGTS